MPAQLSSATGGVAVALHCPVTAESVGAAGGVVSSTTTVCVAVEMFPLPSLKLQVIVYVPWLLYVRGEVVVPVIIPAQLSVVVGALTVALHCPVTVVSVGTAGGLVSSTITVCVAVVILPLPSLKLQMIV